jgi:hypothetical protein
MGMQLHGNFSQNKPQCEGTIPGTAQHGKEQEYFTSTGLEKKQSSETAWLEQDQRKVQCNVN